MRSHNTKLAIVYSLIAACLYALLGVSIKITEEVAPTGVSVFFRQAFSLLALLPLMFIAPKPIQSLKTERLGLHVLRALSSLVSLYCLFYTLKYLPLVDALLLTYTRPLFIPLIVWVWFRKKLGITTWLGLLVGFVGVALILKPDQRVFDVAALTGFGSALTGGISFTLTRKLTSTESANSISFYCFALSLPLAAIPLLYSWQTPSLQIMGMFAVMGILGMLYQFTLTKAYENGKASQIAAMLYSTVIFAALFDYMLDGFSLDRFAAMGMLLILVGSLLTIREKKVPYPPEPPR